MAQADSGFSDALRLELEVPWKKVGGLAVPTVVLGTFVVVACASTIYAAMTRVLPLAAAIPLQTVWAYLAFTVGHEASHGNVVGTRARSAWLESAMGWVMFAVLGLPYSMFKYLHLKHHGATNDPELDPDFRASGSSPVTVAYHCWTVQWGYVRVLRQHLAKGSPGAREALRGVWAYTAVSLGVVAGVLWFGAWKWVLLSWILPAWIAQGFLALVFDWLPHHPHTSRERYRDTRLILVPGLGVLLLGQNLHLIHHLFPRLPLYRYGPCLEALRELLVAKGAPFVGKD